MDQLYSEFPCRNEQIDFLSGFFLDEKCSTPDMIYIYGPHATGKTSLVSRFFEQCESTVMTLVNCIETYTSKLLFESILTQLFNDDVSRTCTNISIFKNYLSMYYQQSEKDKHIILVLDMCEYLESLGEEHFKAFICLRDLTNIQSLSVIFISHLLPEKFSTDLTMAIPLYFPQYNKDELQKILMLDKPEAITDQFYTNYLKSALSVFYRVTRDFCEMSYLVKSNFPKYCEPLEKGSTEDSMALWRNIVPHLKASLLSAYSGTTNISEKTAKLNETASSAKTKSLLAFDLPYFSKYFLIAAYLASYNSAKHDKRLYLKNHGKRRKRKTDEAAKSKESMANVLIGPRDFHLDRLLVIFYSIIEDKPNLTASLMSQISTLVELRLLMQLSDGVLDKPTYKCMASYQCVDSIARTVEFNVSKYLMR